MKVMVINYQKSYNIAWEEADMKLNIGDTHLLGIMRVVMV
jgi:hypothetical protein